MNTISTWFDFLPDAIKQKALTGFIAQRGEEDLSISVESLQDAINCFTWCNTTDGQEYWSLIHKSCSTGVFDVPVMFSTSFTSMLKKIEDSSDVARLLLAGSVTTTTEFCNYVTMRGEMGSYLPKGKEHKMNESGRWSREGRQDMKIGKLARKLLKQSYIDSLNDTDFEKFSNCVKSYISLVGDDDGEGKKLKLRIIKGDDILKAYHVENYSDILGKDSNLWGSCMRSESSQEWLTIYAENSHVIDLLIAEDVEGKVLGRALVWQLMDGRIAMDTIYAPDSIQQTFLDYAINRDWYYKRSQSCHHHDFDGFGGSYFSGYSKLECKVKLTKFNFEYYPYMDSLYYLNDYGILSNGEPNNDYKTLRNTDGSYEESGMIICEVSGDRINEDDSTYISYSRPNGGYIEGSVSDCLLVNTANHGYCLEDDCIQEHTTGDYYLSNDENIVYLSSKDEYRYADDCVYSDELAEFILLEDSVETEDGKVLRQEDTFICCVDGKIYSEDDRLCEIIDGEEMQFYINNLTEFNEQFNTQLHESGAN